MNTDNFLKLMSQMHVAEGAEHQRKSHDYADPEGHNILSNFQRVAANLGISQEMALAVYLQKHLDAIMTYCRTGDVSSEGIEGRIMDARVYLALLRAMVEENRKQ